MANFTGTFRDTDRKLAPWDMKRGGLALAAQVLIAGCMCGVDATAGTIRRGGGVIATFTGPMCGRLKNSFALRNGNTASALATDIVEWEEGIFCWNNIGAITIASRGKLCFADDDQSVSLTNTNVTAGIIEDIDTQGVWVSMGVGMASL